MQLATFLRERKPKALNELAALAEQYMDAHANSKNVLGKPVLKNKDSHDGRSETNEKKRNRSMRPQIVKKCFNCGKLGILLGIVFMQRNLQ